MYEKKRKKNVKLLGCLGKTWYLCRSYFISKNSSNKLMNIV